MPLFPAPRALTRLARLSLSLLVAATAACGGGSDVTAVGDALGGSGGGSNAGGGNGSPTSGQLGSFSATAGSSAIAGFASFATRNSAFAATLTDRDGRGQIVFGRARAAVPGVGSIAVGEVDDDAGLFAGYTDLKTLQTYTSKAGSGTFTVTEVNGERMRGSFRLTLHNAINGSTITLQGTFDAQRL